MVKELLEDLVARGLHPERRYLLEIDGAKALRAGIERVFGRAEVQRCEIHKRRNVKEHLPRSAQGDTDRRIRNAYAMTSYAEAKAELGKIFRQLERINPSAAHSLEEGWRKPSPCTGWAWERCCGKRWLRAIPSSRAFPRSSAWHGM